MTGAINVAIVAADTNVSVGFGVDFQAVIEGRLSASHWDFGDGASGSGALVSHTYSQAGLYEAAVTAYWAAGSEIVTATVTTTVLVEAPIADLAINSAAPTALRAATHLSATVGAGTNITYTWALGDGFLASGEVVTHTYPTPGVYTAVVTASNLVSVEVKLLGGDSADVGAHPVPERREGFPEGVDRLAQELFGGRGNTQSFVSFRGKE